ncbi:pilus assembly protein N-terminal domain-containing protein [Methylobacterium sp. J-026]|uniref:pilus assembly protein N-terminal domain-containing protein n=1 Tax=Methylobacterium sp. J-026 TaxID=2836624 RepID=UPI001FBACE13|nr:pilus assembly protein N-terminal domain-containing protein [Methylobacterium sp. J-026]MCJ2135007.1 pilus assembly protein N-terminal domain-containing protein [Methylobacterium sp. J-026]
MRRTLSNAGRAGLLLLMMGVAAAGQSEPLPVVTVLVDNAKVIRLPEKTATVIVGNPIIAEVTPQKNGVLVLTGKSFGSTNLIALDNAGAMIAETMIRVEASRDSTITVQRGLDRESLSCTPNCQPAVQLGDSASYFGAASGQADARRKLATGGGGAVPAAADH